MSARGQANVAADHGDRLPDGASAEVQHRTMFTHGEQSRHIVTLDHYEMPEPAPDHRRGRFFEGPVRRGVHHVLLTVLCHQFHVGILVGRDRIEEVTFGQDTGTHVLRIDHHRGADPARRHHARRVPQRLRRTDGKDNGGHGVSYLHQVSHPLVPALVNLCRLSSMVSAIKRICQIITGGARRQSAVRFVNMRSGGAGVPADPHRQR